MARPRLALRWTLAATVLAGTAAAPQEGYRLTSTEVVVDRAGRCSAWQLPEDARQSTFATAWDATPTWSPDGRRIAFARLVDVGTRYDTLVWPVEGGPTERVTDDPYDGMHTNWTPS